MKRYKKIIFLSLSDARHISTWSGIPYFMQHEFKKRYVVESIYLGPYASYIDLIIRAVLKMVSFLLCGKYDSSHSLVRAWYHGIYFSKKLKKYEQEESVVLLPAGSSILCYLKTNLPTLYVSDTTFKNMINYYPNFSGLNRLSIKEGNYLEKRAIHKSTYNMYPSEWAAKSAIDDYRADPQKVFVIPFGANIHERIPSVTEKADISKECHLLFLGVNWERKGGRIAYETFNILKEKNYPVSLRICGCVPPFRIIDDEQVKVISYLNKKDKNEYARFREILKQTHWLILPTQAECYGIVFCEASAYSIPSITFDTGGVSSIVYDKINGRLLKTGADAEAFAEIIQYYIQHPDEYKILSQKSYALYAERLNWETWVNKVEQILYKGDITV